MKPLFKGPLTLVAAAVLALLQGPAMADPMRPLTPAAAAASGAPAAGVFNGNTGSGAAAGPVAIQVDRLVAIRNNGDGRRQALFGEQWVAVGARAGNATVQRVTDNSVTLALGKQQLVLHVLPPLVASVDETAQGADDKPASRPQRVQPRVLPSPSLQATALPTSAAVTKPREVAGSGTGSAAPSMPAVAPAPAITAALSPSSTRPTGAP